MAVNSDLLLDALEMVAQDQAQANAQAPEVQPETVGPEKQSTFQGDQIAMLLAGLAGAIGKGDPQSEALAQLATGLTQSKIMGKKRAEQQQQLSQVLDALTGPEVTTTGVTQGQDGKLKITGELQNTLNAQDQEAVAPVSTPGGGGNQTKVPFYQVPDLPDLM